MKPVVTLLGDSLVAGYGLTRGEALPMQLQAALQTIGVNAEIVDAGVSGDATRDGLRRLAGSVPARTTLCVVALGANDLMQTVPPERVRQTLDEIVAQLLARPARVLLCGMRAPPWLGDYARTFDAVFPAVAATRGVPLHPFLLDGVALDPAFNLADRIHPNPAGVRRIAARLAPSVKRALDL